MFLIYACSCLCPIHWRKALNWEWRCSWSSADRRCSNSIWVINNFIAYLGAAYIRYLAVVVLYVHWTKQVWHISEIYLHYVYWIYSCVNNLWFTLVNISLKMSFIFNSSGYHQFIAKRIPNESLRHSNQSVFLIWLAWFTHCVKYPFTLCDTFFDIMIIIAKYIVYRVQCGYKTVMQNEWG